MIYDDLEDPLANLGSKGTQVKGFIKGSSAHVSKKKEKCKKKKKGEDINKPSYEQVKRLSIHDKFDNEIDDLLQDADESIKPKVDIQINDDLQEI